MQDYDAALKLLFRNSASLTRRMLSSRPILRWLDAELPKTQNLRMDLLGEDAEGNLFQFELQSANDPKIGLRMAEYALGTKRLTGRFPRQLVVYVGQAPLNMPSELVGPNLSVSYRVIDIRELDGAELLSSAELGDNIIAILARLQAQRKAVSAIVAKIGKLPESERQTALQQLLILAGLRGLARMVKEEVGKLPLEIDIMENEVLGPPFVKGLEKGLQEGLEKGRQEGELRLLRKQILKRFGPIPKWADARLAGLSADEIEAIGDRIFDAPTIADLFG